MYRTDSVHTSAARSLVLSAILGWAFNAPLLDDAQDLSVADAKAYSQSFELTMSEVA